MGRLSSDDICELSVLCPDGVCCDVDLSALSQWRIGGRADLVLSPSSTEEVSALMRWFNARNINPVVVGLTSNLLFDDSGLRVPCIHIGPRMADVRMTNAEVKVGAGIWVPALARRLMHAGLTGLEHICGIPGTLGGLICMNGGSQRKGVGSCVMTVSSVDSEGRIRTRGGTELGFSYRRSIFHEIREIITEAHLSLEHGDRRAIRLEMLDILVSRSQKFPRKQPNCGSTFVSDPALYEVYGPPGAIIEKLGLKGYRFGGAEVSSIHANFVVNTGTATARDILTVIRDINSAVQKKTGRTLLAEVQYVAPDGTTEPASQVAQRLDGISA